MAFAGNPISAASLEISEDRTSIVLESKAEFRFSLIILRNPERVMLELEGVTLDPLLTGLANQIAADHPYMKPMRIEKSRSRSDAVQLKFELKGEADPSIRTLKPTAGRNHRLVMDIVPLGLAATSLSVHLPRLPQPDVAVASPLSPAVSPLPVGPIEDPNLVLLEVQLDENVLAEAIMSYQYGKETFLPLGELARLLTLAIRTHPDQGTADGFILSELRGFSLNVAQARLMLDEQTQVFDPALVRLHSDDIYVASTLLSRWLPLDFEVDLSRLVLQVRPRERLPIQARLERERLGAKAGISTGYEDPGYPRQDMPYRLLDMPFVDQTLGVGFRTGNGNRQNSANYTAYLTGDLLGMEAALFVRSTERDPSPDLRFTLARHDPDAGLLGLLRARSMIFGSGVTVPSVANISSPSPTGKGYGMTLSNRPINQPTNFDRHTLRGDLPPGWDVELYFNEALVGFQTSRADGRYNFDDQPLAYGSNEFRLVFHGPLGQQRVERQSFLLEQSSTPPGAFYYDLTQYQDDASQSRSVAQFEWGLNKYLIGTGGFVRLPGLTGDSTKTKTAAGTNAADKQLYTNLGLRAFWQPLIISSDFFRSPNGGWLNDSGLKTQVGGVALSFSHAQLHDFSSELFLPSADPLRTRDKMRLDSTIATGFLPRLPVTLEFQREQFQSGSTNLSATGRVAAYVNRTSLANQLIWQTSGGHTSASGVLQVSRRVGVIGLTGQLGYTLKPEANLETVVLSADKQLGERYLLNLGLVRSVSGRETLYTANLNKSLGSYGLGLGMSYSSLGSLTMGLQLFIAMGREPRQSQWWFDAQPKADGGAASVRIFLDNNANGLMDVGEEPIQNAAITVNGSRALARTNGAGIAWLDRLPIRQGVDIAIDTQTLEDPYWVPQRKGVRFVPRPGHAAELDFPVILTSEIDGTVYLVEKTARRGIGDVVIELLDINRSVVSATKSSSDGYYIVPAVAQGRYYLQVSPKQLKQFGLRDPGVRIITILPDGKFINGVDFLLTKDSSRSPR